MSEVFETAPFDHSGIPPRGIGLGPGGAARAARPVRGRREPTPKARAPASGAVAPAAPADTLYIDVGRVL